VSSDAVSKMQKCCKICLQLELCPGTSWESPLARLNRPTSRRQGTGRVGRHHQNRNLQLHH